MAVELFGVELVDDLLVAGGYFAPVTLRPRVLVDGNGHRFRSPALRAGLHLVGGPGTTHLEHPITLEVA